MEIKYNGGRAFCHISTKASFDPVKTIYLCPSDNDAKSLDVAEEFAVKSGWEEGWKQADTSLLKNIYNETKNSFKTQNGKAIWGRMGSLWCWETLLFCVGYEEGADFLAVFTSNNPNFAAATVLIGNKNNYQPTDDISDHWLVKNVSKDYCIKNSDIAAKVVSYTNDDVIEPQKLYDEIISHNIRWKNGPDGSLSDIKTEEELLKEATNRKYDISLNGKTYSYIVHKPINLKDTKAPVVFTVHGRGEPAWMFIQKNGWCELSDKTGEFIVVSVDSPGNIWFLDRDRECFEIIINSLKKDYSIDKERIYLTGFSNGAIMTREMALYSPQLFAAIAASNGPKFDSVSMGEKEALTYEGEPSEIVLKDIESFSKENWEMPAIFFYGDNDPAAKEEENPVKKLFLDANGCEELNVKELNPNKHLLGEGYVQRDRFKIFAYPSKTHSGEILQYTIIMKNMPHGAIPDESLFTWNFLKQFKRIDGDKAVTFL